MKLRELMRIWIRSIIEKEKGIEATSLDDPMRTFRINNLSTSFVVRFDKTGQISDLRRGFELALEVLKMLPVNHPNHAGTVFGLIKHCVTLHEKTGQREYIDQILEFIDGVLKAAPPDYPARPHFLIASLKAIGIQYAHSGAV
jgi:hypothetical protein